ncbi:MAG TPA: hypothetical protein PKY82_00910 [Pyrinomonadaceae bacterium]|nr:hypothetical protein [Pyrinomonadaceae bacterium]
MKKIILAVSILTIFLTACSKTETNLTANSNSAGNSTKNAATAQVSPTIDPNLQATFPFKDFPAVETTAKAGEVVLVPSYNWLQEANVKGADKVTMIWYAQKMSAPDKEMSEVEFMSDKKKVPNAYIVAIPAGQKAKKGDILLTWWQSGSGLQRAIVVDDANPAEPVVRYLDLDYDNPAKSSDGKTSIGQMDEKLKPNSFVKINAPFDVGSMVAVQDGADQKPAQVIRVAGDKVFVSGFAGKIDVVDKSRCTPFPLVSNAKVGEKVKAVWVSSLKEGTVTKFDAAIGRVFIKFDVDNKEKAISFGEIMK